MWSWCSKSRVLPTTFPGNKLRQTSSQICSFSSLSTLNVIDVYSLPSSPTSKVSHFKFCISNIKGKSRQVCVKNLSPEEVLQVITATGRPRQVTGISSFHPFTRHNVRVTSAGGMVIIMAHSHAEEKDGEMDRHCERALEQFVKPVNHFFLLGGCNADLEKD